MGTMPSISGFHEYDVFISFRGEDTRMNFTNHLYHELNCEKIKVFIDEKDLGKGEEISSTLFKAIQNSKISLIIFSANYATSTWCLKELVHILNCKQKNGQIVVPIFYGVDPSHVRNQNESFATAFVKHQQRFEDGTEKLQEWSAALKKACNISGWDSRNKYQSELVKEIVQFVVSKVRPRPTADLKGQVGMSRQLPKLEIASASSCTSSCSTADSEGLVGINRQLEQIESLLCFGSEEVRVLGIWGMGGIGKTTLARAVFNRFSSQFEGCCFLKNVRQELNLHGQAYLESKFFSKLMGEKDKKKVNKFDTYKISQKRVLVVLDNVDGSELQEHLVRVRNWFGSGSRIIITTRDQQLLRECTVDAGYRVDELNDDEALRLFHLNAFRGRHVVSDCDRLSQAVVDYSKGIPLALKVFGSFLNYRCTNQWENALDELIMDPSNKIYQALRVSYDELDNHSKETFLRMSFFYDGRAVGFIRKKLKKSGFDVNRPGIRKLMQKSLISIDDDGLIYMHDLIRRMAWQIVRQSTTKGDGNYGNKGIGAEGKFFDMSNFDYKELPLRRPVFGTRCHNCYDYPRKSLPSSQLGQFSSDVQKDLINDFLNYDVHWTKNNHYVANKLTGVLVPINATYEEFTDLIRKEINLDDQLTIEYQIQRGSTRISIESNEHVRFYLELKKKETNNTAFPLCIMTTTSSTMPSNEGSNDLFQSEEYHDPAIHQELVVDSKYKNCQALIQAFIFFSLLLLLFFFFGGTVFIHAP